MIGFIFLFRALREQILKCSSIDEQLTIFRGRVLFTQKDYQKRNELKNILQKILNESGLDCVLHFFGSTTNSLGFRTSDIDLFLELKEENNFCLTVGFERAISYLKQIRGTFQRSLRPLTITEPVESRRCPIIKLDFSSFAQISRKSKKSIKTGISCDINLTNGLGIINTKLIRLYCEFERRFQELALIVRFWGKNNAFIDGLNAFTSYALTQLVIFFCQSLSPPLLPTVDQLIDMAEESVIIDGRECKLCEDVNQIPKSQNTDSLIELLDKFFKFYANFDFTTQVIRPKTGLTVHKKVAKDLKLMRNQKNIADVINFKMSSIVSIEDPFNLSHNLTANIKYEVFDRFLEYVKHIALKSDIIFAQNKSENGANDWGISKIITKFDPTEGYQSIFGRHIFHPMVRQILESPETTTQTMISAMIKEYFDLILLSMERVFRVRPQIKINTELNEDITPFAIYTIETKGILSKIFNSKERTDIKKDLKLNKKTKKQRIDKEIGITDEIIGKFKDKPIDENPLKFQFCLLCYTRPSGPYIELKTLEVSPEDSNVRKTLKELFEWIPNLIEDKQKS